MSISKYVFFAKILYYVAHHVALERKENLGCINQIMLKQQQ